MTGFINKNKQKRLRREAKNNKNSNKNIIKNTTNLNSADKNDNRKNVEKQILNIIKNDNDNNKKNYKINNKISTKSKKNIFNHSKIVVLFAGILLFLSVFTAYKKGFNKGIDFAGGIVVEVECNNCNANILSKELTKQLGFSVLHQEIEGGYLFKTASAGTNYDKTISIFKQIFTKHNVKIIRTDYVSAQMSASFLEDSIIACIFAFICIGIYVIIRFSVKFSIAGILTLIFDTIMVIGFISLAKIEVCLITLTALLTIIGYCINDKIVVFDRIRDNLYGNEQITEIIKKSVKLVLTRSVLTSLTTIIATTSLLFFGDRTIYELGLTISCGIIIGTISSLLVASGFIVSKLDIPIFIFSTISRFLISSSIYVSSLTDCFFL